MGFIFGSNGILRIEGSINYIETNLKRKDGFKFVRYVLDLKVKNSNGNIVLAMNEKGREGHLTVTEAKERCIRKIEKKLRKKMIKRLNSYFDNLIVKE
jgi:hypothetical protein